MPLQESSDRVMFDSHWFVSPPTGSGRMKKISLAIDMLEVTSFDTDATSPGARGTVHGHVTLRLCGTQTQGYDTCQQGSCAAIGTCNVLLTGTPCVGC
jgi:hypothetical protein